MQSTHSFTYSNYGVMLKTISNDVAFSLYDGYRHISNGLLTNVDVDIQHKINCAIAYKKYVVNLLMLIAGFVLNKGQNWYCTPYGRLYSRFGNKD